MTGVFTRERRGDWTDTEEKAETGGQLEAYRTLSIAGSHQKPGERHGMVSPQSSRRNQPYQGFEFGLLDPER